MNTFKLLADENIAAAVIDQLDGKGVEIRRVSRLLPEDTPDPDVLAYALKRLNIDLSFDTILHWPACPRTKTAPILPKASVKALLFSP